MFGDIRLFRLNWEWESADGRRYDFPVRTYLSGEARLLAVSREAGGEWAIGQGALRAEVKRFARWLYENQAPVAPGRIRCEIETSEWRVLPWTTEVVTWPVDAAPVANRVPEEP